MKLLRNQWSLVFLLGIGLGIAVAIGLAILGRGSFEQLILNLMIAVWGLPLLLVVAIVCGGIWWRQGRRWAARITRGAITLMIVAIVQLGAIFIGARFASIDVAQAKVYCEQLIPQIEKHRKQYGQYPQTIAELKSFPKQPRLLRDKEFYNGSQDGFSFVIQDPSALLGAWEYNHKSQKWQYLD